MDNILIGMAAAALGFFLYVYVVPLYSAVSATLENLPF